MIDFTPEICKLNLADFYQHGYEIVRAAGSRLSQ